MSRVTNVVIMISELPATEEKFLAHLNLFKDGMVWFSLDPREHFGGNKCGEVEVFTAAINYCDISALCMHFKIGTRGLLFHWYPIKGRLRPTEKQSSERIRRSKHAAKP